MKSIFEPYFDGAFTDQEVKQVIVENVECTFSDWEEGQGVTYSEIIGIGNDVVRDLIGDDAFERKEYQQDDYHRVQVMTHEFANAYLMSLEAK